MRPFRWTAPLMLILGLALGACAEDDGDAEGGDDDGDGLMCTGAEDPITAGTTKAGANGNFTIEMLGATPEEHVVGEATS